MVSLNHRREVTTLEVKMVVPRWKYKEFRRRLPEVDGFFAMIRTYNKIWKQTTRIYAIYFDLDDSTKEAYEFLCKMPS